MRKSLLIILLVFICSMSVNAESRVIFTGEEIYDEDIGIFVMPAKKAYGVTSPFTIMHLFCHMKKLGFDRIIFIISWQITGIKTYLLIFL